MNVAGDPAKTPLRVAVAENEPSRQIATRGRTIWSVDGTSRARGLQAIGTTPIATFTYAFSGNFRGADATGRTTVAGLLREDVVFTDPGKHSCTSNTLAWTGVG